jgi:hypothetical protein
MYKIGSTSTLAPGRFTSAGMMSGNSPGISPVSDTHEQFAGFLLHDVDMLNKQTGSVAEMQGVIIRAGHIRLAHIHDAYGNSAWLLNMLKEANAKYNWTNFVFDYTITSPGPVSP